MDAQLQEVRENVLAGVAKDYSISEVGMLQYQGQICVQADVGIRREILCNALNFLIRFRTLIRRPRGP